MPTKANNTAIASVIAIVTGAIALGASLFQITGLSNYLSENVVKIIVALFSVILGVILGRFLMKKADSR
jgi:hypothetical protein